MDLHSHDTNLGIFQLEVQGLTVVVYCYCLHHNVVFHVYLVIKIYGIYTHAQLDGRFWISVGHQLAKKGKEYRKR